MYSSLGGDLKSSSTEARGENRKEDKRIPTANIWNI